MKEAFLDVRVQRTIKKLPRRLSYYLEEITVKETITKAKISRGAFYLHYQDENDLIKKLKNNYLPHFFHKFKPLLMANASIFS